MPWRLEAVDGPCPDKDRTTLWFDLRNGEPPFPTPGGGGRKEDQWSVGWRGVHIGDSEIAGPWPSVADGEECLRAYLEEARPAMSATLPFRSTKSLRSEEDTKKPGRPSTDRV